MHAIITPVIITFNETDNIARVLQRLRWAPRVIVVDSFSTDDTEILCRSFPNVEFVQRAFDSPAGQFNHGASLASTPWVFALGADYVMSEELIDELGELKPAADVTALQVSFRYCINGRPLRANLYPSATMMYLRECCHFLQDGHTERLVNARRVAELRGKIDHDDRKPLSRWLQSQIKYSDQECRKLLALEHGEGRIQDRIRKLIFIAPPLVLAYTLFVKGLVLDGWHGWYYALQRALAEMMLALRLIERRFKP
jgi:glycosyltransferase involved in cell wall biosynthesis